MYQKILVALDRSDITDAVFNQSLNLAKATRASLRLLHVLSSEDEHSPMPILPGTENIYWSPGTTVDIDALQKQWHQYSVECLQSLQHHTKVACAAGIQADYQQVAGIAGKTICQVAQQWEADLIMVGNRGRVGFREFVLGSVSNYVMHHAPCSVLIVKSGPE